jgi:hypothetical protein
MYLLSSDKVYCNPGALGGTIWVAEMSQESSAPMLTETQIRKAKPGEKAKRLWDERGMYLEVTPTGSKLWRFKYRIDGREKRIGLGKYQMSV